MKPRYILNNYNMLEYSRWVIMTANVSYIRQTAGNCFIQSTEDVFQALTFETRAAARKYIKIVKSDINFIGRGRDWFPTRARMVVTTHYAKTNDALQLIMPRQTMRSTRFIAKPGELAARWAKLPEDKPDLVFFNGEGAGRADAHFLYSSLCSTVYRLPSDPSFIKELENRGYDITTLKFSIQKKKGI